jgi:electron transport complex protein RnfD
MRDQKKLIVSHAPFWHNGSRVTDRSHHTLLALLPAAVVGIAQYGLPAFGVLALAVASAVLWELGFNRAAKQPYSAGDGTAAVIGLVFGMMLPAATPWWAVVTGTFVAVVVGRQIFGGLGANPFNPVAVSLAILMVSWKSVLDFDSALVNFTFDFNPAYHLTAAKAIGAGAVQNLSLVDLLIGRQIGGIGSTCGIALIVGGLYLMLRGVIRWEISASFLAGVFVTAFIFNLADPVRYASPWFHLLTGYTLIGAFFLATEDSSSPVNFIPMLIFGALVGTVTVMIRNIGAFPDGLVFALLVGNLVQPLLDKIRPNALGKVA